MLSSSGRLSHLRSALPKFESKVGKEKKWKNYLGPYPTHLTFLKKIKKTLLQEKIYNYNKLYNLILLFTLNFFLSIIIVIMFNWF